MKKVLFFFMITTPLLTFCMKRPFRKAHSDSSLLDIRSIPVKKQVSTPSLSRYKILEKKPALAYVLLVLGKNLRLDHEVSAQANELYYIAQRVNPDKRDLLEDTHAFDFMAKIINKKNREKSSRVEVKGISSRKAKDINSSKDLSI